MQSSSKEDSVETPAGSSLVFAPIRRGSPPRESPPRGAALVVPTGILFRRKKISIYHYYYTNRLPVNE